MRSLSSKTADFFGQGVSCFVDGLVRVCEKQDDEPGDKEKDERENRLPVGACASDDDAEDEWAQP